MAKLSGKSGTVSVDAATIQVRNWEFTQTADMLDVTSADSSGNREFISGLTGATGSFTAQWKSDENPHSDPPDILPGNSLACIFQAGITGGPKYTVTALVNEITTSNPIEGVIEYSVSFTVTGAVTRAVEI